MEKPLLLSFEKHVYGGDVLSHLPDGRAIFIPLGLPGESAWVEVTEEKKRYARGRIIKLENISPHRIPAKCRYFGVCGGCHYQNMTYDDQLKTKSEILIDQFERQAGVDVRNLLQVFAAPEEFGYRSTIQLHVNNDGSLGFQEAGGNRVILIDECPIFGGDLKNLVESVIFEPESGIQRVQARVSDDDDLLLVLESTQMDPPELELDFPASVVYQAEETSMVLAGDDFQWFTIGEKPFLVSAESFLQANLKVAETMVDFVVKHTPLNDGDMVLDLYCGIGLFTRFLAEKGGRLIGVESSPSAVEDFAVNLDEFDDIAIYEGLAEAVLPALDIQPAVCVMDPPRAGLHPLVVDRLIQMEIPRLIYISCDPTTQARDIKKLMQNGYEIKQIALFDQFPQTYHMESIAVMVRGKG